jgi:1-Cys peroxiredoxin 6
LFGKSSPTQDDTETGAPAQMENKSATQPIKASGGEEEHPMGESGSEQSQKLESSAQGDDQLHKLEEENNETLHKQESHTKQEEKDKLEQGQHAYAALLIGEKGKTENVEQIELQQKEDEQEPSGKLEKEEIPPTERDHPSLGQQGAEEEKEAPPMFKSMMDSIRNRFASPTMQKLVSTYKSHFLTLGEEMPNFEAHTTKGTIKLHEHFGNDWGILFSHTKAFESVGLTELNMATQFFDDFSLRHCKLMALSCDTVLAHHEWNKDVLSYNKKLFDVHLQVLPFPTMSDVDRSISHRLGILDPAAVDDNGEPLTARAVFIVSPNHKVAFSCMYPATTGLNFREILRVFDALRATSNRDLSTPVDWMPGDDCLLNDISPSTFAEKLFGQRVHSLKHSAVRFVPDPRSEEREQQDSEQTAKPIPPYEVSALNLGDEMPNFVNRGVSILDMLKGSWGLIMSISHPFSAVCISEMSKALQLSSELESHNCKLIVLSRVNLTQEWLEDVIHFENNKSPGLLNYVVDKNQEMAAGLGLLDNNTLDLDGNPTLAHGVFIVDPLLKLKLSMLYPANVGRSWKEIIRVLDSLKLTTAFPGIATAENWRLGKKCVLLNETTEEEINKKLQGEVEIQNFHVPSGRFYFRYIDNPYEIEEHNRNKTLSEETDLYERQNKQEEEQKQHKVKQESDKFDMEQRKRKQQAHTEEKHKEEELMEGREITTEVREE